MKARLGFVTNSSSTSFLLPIKDRGSRSEIESKLVYHGVSKDVLDNICHEIFKAEPLREIDMVDAVRDFVSNFAYDEADQILKSDADSELDWDNIYDQQIKFYTQKLALELFRLYPDHIWIHLKFEECSAEESAMICPIYDIANDLFNS